jgi:hypothetical protein
MVPASLHDFLIASIGASASFIGLLFVAISFIPDVVKNDRELFSSRRLLAEGAFGALINIFFVALVGLIPGANIGYVFLVTALLGCKTVYSTRPFGTKHFTDNIITFILSAFIFIVEGLFGIVLIWGSHRLNKFEFMTLILYLFSIALARAWELTGIRNT